MGARVARNSSPGYDGKSHLVAGCFPLINTSHAKGKKILKITILTTTGSASVVVPAAKPCAQENQAWIAGLRFNCNFATLHQANADWRWPTACDADKCQQGLRPSCQSLAKFPRGVPCQQPAEGAEPVARRSPCPKPSQTAKAFQTAMNVPFWRAVSRVLQRMLSGRPGACKQAVSFPRIAAQIGLAAGDHQSSAD